MNSTAPSECDVVVDASELVLAGLKESGNMLDMALVIIAEVSYNATAVFSVLRVIPDLHVPLSRCCVSAEKPLKRFLHTCGSTHVSGL
jgi:hypothetical protein